MEGLDKTPSAAEKPKDGTGATHTESGEQSTQTGEQSTQTFIHPSTLPRPRPCHVFYKDIPVGNPSFTNILNQVTSIKLDRGHFLLWQNIVLPILRSYKLEGHLTRKTIKPEHTIVVPPSEEDPEGLMMPNPELDVWLMADQLLVGWLYNSMTPEVAAQVMGHDDAQTLWTSIQE